jgi:hypothetical protein
MNDEKVLLPFEESKLCGKYRDYLITKRKNYEVLLRDLPELWDCFLALDEVWMRGLSDMETNHVPSRALITSFFRSAHGNIRIAFELAFSTAINQAFNIMRTSIDAAVIAHKIHREPKLAAVWLQKDRGPLEKKAYKQAFETHRQKSMFPQEHGLADLYKFYCAYSDWGVHPGLPAIAIRNKTETKGNQHILHFTYLEADPERIPSFVWMILKPSALVEATFFNCFEQRLKLDVDLLRMRYVFASKMSHAEKIVATHFGRGTIS